MAKKEYSYAENSMGFSQHGFNHMFFFNGRRFNSPLRLQDSSSLQALGHPKICNEVLECFREPMKCWSSRKQHPVSLRLLLYFHHSDRISSGVIPLALCHRENGSHVCLERDPKLNNTYTFIVNTAQVLFLHVLSPDATEQFSSISSYTHFLTSS